MSNEPIDIKCKKYYNEVREVLLEVMFITECRNQKPRWIYITDRGVQHDISGSVRIAGDWRVHNNSHFYRHIVFGESEYSLRGGFDSGCSLTKVLEIMRESFPKSLYSDIKRWNGEIERMYMEYVL